MHIVHISTVKGYISTSEVQFYFKSSTVNIHISTVNVHSSAAEGHSCILKVYISTMKLYTFTVKVHITTINVPQFYCKGLHSYYECS